MNKKSLIILCVIFTLLIGLVFVKKGMKLSVPTTEEVSAIVTAPVSSDSISEITLRLGDGMEEGEDSSQNVRLRKVSDQWVVESQYGVRANDRVITSALEKLDRLEGEMRSDKAELLGDYGISGDKALHILLEHDGGVVHLVVGMEKAGFQNNFVRFGEKNAVYVVNENLLTAFGVRGDEGEEYLDVGKWSDKRITNLVVDNLIGVAITQTANGVDEMVIDVRKNMVNDKKQWQSVQPYSFGLSASKIKKIAENFNSTYAREIIAPDQGEAFEAPGWTGTFTFEGGDQVKLVRGAKDAEEKNYYLKVEGAAYYYLVPVSTFTGREKQQGDIFAANPLKVEEGGIEAISVEDKDGGKELNAVKVSLESGEVAVAEGEAEVQEERQEDVWKSPDGAVIETAKVRDVINKIKDMNLEAVPKTASSEGTLTITITKEGVVQEYTISNGVKLESGKECHLLKVKGEDQDYCASKDHVAAIKSALP